MMLMLMLKNNFSVSLIFNGPFPPAFLFMVVFIER